MWAKLTGQQKLCLAAVAFLALLLSSTALGLILQSESQPQAKEEAADRSLDLQQLLKEAQDRYYAGDYAASIKQYEQILAEVDSEQARANLAALYETLGRYEAARQQYQKLAAAYDKPSYRLSLAKAAYNLGNLATARKELTSLTTEETIDDYLQQEAYYYLFLLAEGQGELSRAQAYLKESLAAQEWALGYYKLANLAFRRADYKQAVEHYQAALAQDGSLKGVKKKLALSYLRLGKDKSAAKYLQQAQRENRYDKLIEEKIAQLKPDYPQYFKQSAITPPQKSELPQEVDFKEIEAPAKSGRKLRIGIMTEQVRIFARVGSDFELLRAGKVIAHGEAGALITARTEGGARVKIGEEEFSLASPLTIRPLDYVPILVHQVEYGADYYWGGRVDMQYRGQLELRANSTGLTAINILPLEAYLMSVVPSEMSAAWPLEALKVQSVAARSYTLANLDKHKEESYDLCSTVHCAAYRGLRREHPRSNRAVQATAGEIMTYQGRPINAVYSANSGGHTENSEDVWNFAVPYLKGVSTHEVGPDFPLPPAQLKEWLQEKPTSYSQDNQYTKESHYRWQRELKVAYLEERLGFEEIKSIRPTNRGVGGSVEALLVSGTDKEKVIKSGLRYKFGGLRSNRFWIQPQYRKGVLESFIFYGGGWGHNVGMDQVAVASMADSGYSYREILRHFYTDVQFKTR